MITATVVVASSLQRRVNVKVMFYLCLLKYHAMKMYPVLN